MDAGDPTPRPDQSPRQNCSRPWPPELELADHRHEPRAAAANSFPHAESLTLSSVWSMPSLDAADAALSDPQGGSFAYRRDAHPNARTLAQKLAYLHGAESCVLTAQGMSALAA